MKIKTVQDYEDINCGCCPPVKCITPDFHVKGLRVYNCGYQLPFHEDNTPDQLNKRYKTKFASILYRSEDDTLDILEGHQVAWDKEYILDTEVDPPAIVCREKLTRRDYQYDSKSYIYVNGEKVLDQTILTTTSLSSNGRCVGTTKITYPYSGDPDEEYFEEYCALIAPGPDNTFEKDTETSYRYRFESDTITYVLRHAYSNEVILQDMGSKATELMEEIEQWEAENNIEEIGDPRDPWPINEVNGIFPESFQLSYVVPDPDDTAPLSAARTYTTDDLLPYMFQRTKVRYRVPSAYLSGGEYWDEENQTSKRTRYVVTHNKANFDVPLSDAEYKNLENTQYGSFTFTWSPGDNDPETGGWSDWVKLLNIGATNTPWAEVIFNVNVTCVGNTPMGNPPTGLDFGLERWRCTYGVVNLRDIDTLQGVTLSPTCTAAPPEEIEVIQEENEKFDDEGQPPEIPEG